MAWGSLQHEAALHWSATALLNASVQVLVAFLVLLCTLLNFVTSSFIRASGFHIPCSCCAHLQKEPLGNAVETSRHAFVSQKPNSISASLVSEARLGDIDHDDEYFREAELNKLEYLSKIDATTESACESSLEAFSEVGGAASEDTCAQRSEQVNENFNDRSQEDVGRNQYAKDQELLQALQSERESMVALYSELEEERNSSATAASEALAMISRLQEEKAAVQMESRQFQRMVMEKAMYDQEAIEVLKEILAKREEERIALEEEMLLYKERLEALLMELRDSAERAGRDYEPMPLLEGITMDDKVTSPKYERAELLIAERISPNVRLVKNEESEFLDRLNKTKSQLLTALLQEGIPEPASAFVEPASFANEIHEAMVKLPVRAESLSTLDHDSHKASLGLAAIKTGREIGLPVPPPRVLKKDMVKDDGEASDMPVSVSSEVDLPTLAIAEEQIEQPLAEDDDKAVDEPVSASREVDLPALPFAAVKEQNGEELLKGDGKPAGRPEFVSLLSLKRRWGARGSQEVSVDTLAKAKEDRRIEEKRLSVLEYVRNLEEQLQQQAGKPPLQVTKASVDGREQDASFKTPGQFESSSVSETSGSSGGLERDDLVQRRLFADGDSLEKEYDMNASQDEGDHKICAQQYICNAESDGKVSNDDGEFFIDAGKSEESPDEALFVHDVYEVQNHPNAAQSKFGVWVAGTMSGLEMQSPVSDRLGKPDNLNVEEEHLRNINEREGQFLSNARAFPQEDDDSGFETQWKDIQRAQHKDFPSLRKENSRSLVEEEVEQLTYRLKALEADRYLMKQTIDSLRRENGEMKLIQEIAQQLRELRGMEQNEVQLTNVSSHTLQFQVGVAQADPSTCKKRRFSSTPRGSSCRPGTPRSGLARTSSRSLLDVCTEGGNYTPCGIVS